MFGKKPTGDNTPRETSDFEMSADQMAAHLQADMETEPTGEAEIVGIITDQAEVTTLLEQLLTLFPGKQKGSES